ncbi:MAG: phosphatidate cytidylyltransferase [Spirochaetaceae bacterium]|jgi:phosphatidate cytidylyltransferase|nr:phosphatidate cytidylyltransferase [Spirochaetaceae bacterium]
MNKRTLIERLLIFFIGLPLSLALVAFLPQKNHLAVNILITIFCALGAVELSGMLKKKGLGLRRVEAAILGAATPLAMTLLVSFHVDSMIIPILLMGSASWLLVSRIFLSEKKLDDAIVGISAGFTVILYPSLFFSWIILMNRLPDSDYLIIAFLCIVMVNDSLAWAFGIIFGKNNRGIIAVSPNKSIVGFIAGLVSSALVGIGLALLLPNAFTSARFPPIVSGLVLGFLTGIAAVLGDLAESAIKRSAGVKDSGFVIPGRGGVLDSIDSLSLAAPVYYIVYRLLFV